MDTITGLIPESELLELVNEDEIARGAAATPVTITTSSWPCIIAGVVLTFTAAACPTSACTRRC